MPVTVESRLVFILFFFVIWALLGLVPWALAAVLVRGRRALLALPMAVAAACLGGVAVPLLGLRDAMGLLISLPTAVVASALGSVGGIRLAQRLGLAGEDRPPESGEPREVS